MAKKRVQIPPAAQAKIQFDSDRTCCVCRQPGKPFQIHHIDEDPSNNDPKNLAVLCRDCHDQTMIRGTFNRRLSPDVVTLYRDDWLAVVAQRRAEERDKEASSSSSRVADFPGMVEKLEILKERGEFELLAMEYDVLGNNNLRDKYIELSLKKQPSDFSTIFLRSMQGAIDKIPRNAIDRVVELQTKHEDWTQLGRTYDEIGDYEKAIINYCKGIIKSLEDGNKFSGAYYLRELSEKVLYLKIFEDTFNKYEAEGNIWWALRSLQELGWWSEIEDLLRRNEEAILESGDHLLLKEFYSITGDVEAFRELELRDAQTMFSDPDSGVIGFVGINDDDGQSGSDGQDDG
jgi:tetratricopeptide (TPR) repeat protein